MAEAIDRKTVRRLIEQGAQIVDVLPAEEYGEDHLPGAVNLPLRKIEAESCGALDRARPIIVYCADSAWDLSPRAACRLQTLGFSEVYDYQAGIKDWLGAGLPTEGLNAQHPRLADVARRDVPTCSLDERLGDVRDRVAAAGWDACVVVSPELVVLGLLRAKELSTDPDLLVEQAMRPGPSTYRPSVSVTKMRRIMTDRNLDSSPVTTSDGRLVGLVRKQDIA